MKSVKSTIGRFALSLVGPLLVLALPGCVVTSGQLIFGNGKNDWDLGRTKFVSEEIAARYAAGQALQTAHPCVPPPGQASDAPMARTGTSTVAFYDGPANRWVPTTFGDVGALGDAVKAAVGAHGAAVTDMACVFTVTQGPTPTTQAEQIFGTSLGVVGVSPQDGRVFFYSGLPQSAYVTSLMPLFDASGSFWVGFRTDGTVSPLWNCQAANHTCTNASAGLSSGVTRVNVLVTAGNDRIVGTDSGAYRAGGGTLQPIAGLEKAAVNTAVVVSGNRIHLGTAAGLYSSSDHLSAVAESALPGEAVTALAGGGSNVGVNFVTRGFFSSGDAGATFAPHAGPAGSSTMNSLVTFGTGFVASTDAGVFRTTDRGMTWTPFSTGLVGGAVNQVAVDTGGAFLATGSGLFGSTSGGPWTLLDPGAANVVLARGNNLFAMGASGASAIRSIDLGVTFRHDVSGLPSGGPPSSAASNDTTFFLTFPFVGLSSSSDFGATWTRVQIGSSPTFPATAVAVNGSGNGVAVGGSTGQVAVSTDGGRTFPTVKLAGTGVVSALAFQGGNLFAGFSGGSSPPPVMVSTDMGNTWTPTGSDLSIYAFGPVAITSPSQSRREEAAGGTRLFAGTPGGLYMSTDAGASWTLVSKSLFGTAVNTLSAAADRLYVGTNGIGAQEILLPLSVTRIVPVVLDVASGAAHYTSELSLTNRGATPVSVSLTYTASLGTGSGTVDEDLAAGRQLVIPDVIAYLRNKGLAIPGSQAGTLVLTFVGAEAPDVVAATARTTALTAAPQPVGSAGLAYAAVSPGIGTTGRLIVYGLRSNGTDRSNLAVYNTTTDPVTVKVTAYSGDGTGASAVIAASDTLGPYGWKQYNGILAAAGFANGYVAVERVSAAGAFSAYGVVNDNGTNDGSFLLPHTDGGLLPYLNVPVLVETSAFLSELVLANSGTTTAHLTLTYAESLDAAGGGGNVAVTLPPGTQQIIPNAIAYLRSHGVSIGPPGRNYAGALHVAVIGAAVDDLYAGARTASQSPGGGQFGLFTPAFYPGTEGAGSAYVYGLRADANNRSNVAVVNTGLAADGSITLRLQAYDGDAGGIAKGDPTDVVVAPGAWKQINGFLGSKGVANGWVKVTLVSGGAPWIAYGVINDGGAPGQRTSDGAYVPMSR